MRIPALLLLAVLLVSGPAFAEPLTRETAHEYLVLLGAEKNLKTSIDAIMTPMLDGVLRGVAKSMSD